MIRAADDFEAIRQNLRLNAQAEERCACPKNPDTKLPTGEINPHCPTHGSWLGDREKK